MTDAKNPGTDQEVEGHVSASSHCYLPEVAGISEEVVLQDINSNCKKNGLSKVSGCFNYRTFHCF